MNQHEYAEAARAFFRLNGVYRYRRKKINDMSDNEVIEKCHWWYTENGRLESYLRFEETFLSKKNN